MLFTKFCAILEIGEVHILLLNNLESCCRSLLSDNAALHRLHTDSSMAIFLLRRFMSKDFCHQVLRIAVNHRPHEFPVDSRMAVSHIKSVLAVDNARSEYAVALRRPGIESSVRIEGAVAIYLEEDQDEQVR